MTLRNDSRAADDRPSLLSPRALRQLRNRCAAILHGLPFPVPFDEEIFCSSLGTLRGRPIVLRPVPLRQLINHEDIVFGFIAPEQQRDVLYFERDTRRMHRIAIIAQEIAHLLLGHQPGEIAPLDLLIQLRRLAPGSSIGHLHQRNGAPSREEREAEIFATMFVERVARQEEQTAPPPASKREPGQSTLLQRLTADLEGE